MGRRGWPALTSLVLGPLVLVASPDGRARATARDPCSVPPSASIIAAAGPTSVVRYEHFRYAGCYRGRQKLLVLDADPDGHDNPPRVGPFAVAGRYAAFGATYYGRESDIELTVCDVRAGRGRRFGRVLNLVPADRDEHARVRSIAIASHGGVAFLVTHPRYFEVHVADRSGEREVDSGPLVDRSSLAVGGDFAYWRDAGETHSVALDGSAVDATSTQDPPWVTALACGGPVKTAAAAIAPR